MRNIIYNPTLEEYKYPLGGLTVYEEANINILIDASYNIYNLKIVIEDDEKNVILDKGLIYKGSICIDNHLYNKFSVNISFDKPYLYFYYFAFNDCYGLHYIGRDELLDAVLTDNDPIKYQINVRDKVKKSDFSWYQGKVMYQIMVDRFNRPKDFDINKVDLSYKYNYILHKDFSENICDFPFNGDYHVDFYCGSLRGVIEKLEYLKELNVGVIYLNPIFLSPTSHKYNTSDYMLIDPMYGTIDDFKELINKAKELGIYIILDGVFNHTGDDSIYFNKYHHFESIGAWESKSSIFHKWYDFNDFDHNKDDYRSWWGIKTLPSVNQNSKFVTFITGVDGVINTWMNEGIKGFRLDVVDELNDSFVTKINKAIKKVDRDSIVIGEVWEDATNKIAYSKRRQYFNGHELDSVMNYPIKDGVIDYLRNGNLKSLIIKVREEINNYNQHNLNLLMNILGTHDTARILTTLSNTDFSDRTINKLTYRLSEDDYNKAIEKVKMAYLIIYTLPGIPCIYYGDEVGLEGFQDPYCRKAMEFKDSILLDYLKVLGSIRKDPVFSDGRYKELSWDNQIYIYERSKDNNRYIIIINNSGNDYNYYLIEGIDVINNINYSNAFIFIKNNTGVIIKVL